MVKLFKNYVLSFFIASTFFLSQTINVNANYLENTPPKEELSIPLMALKNAKSDTVSTTAFYTPSVSYQIENGTASEGKVEKVVEPITIVVGILAAGYGISFIGSIIGWIKDIVLMFK